MPKINELYPSRFLKAEDLNGEDVSYTIQGLELEQVGSDQEDKDKPVLYFKEVDKGLILNKTNFKTVAGIHGADSDDWAGKKITLYPTEVEFSGQNTLGIRVRLLAPKPAPKPVEKVIQRPPIPYEPEFSEEETSADPIEDVPF